MIFPWIISQKKTQNNIGYKIYISTRSNCLFNYSILSLKVELNSEKRKTITFTIHNLLYILYIIVISHNYYIHIHTSLIVKPYIVKYHNILIRMSCHTYLPITITIFLQDIILIHEIADIFSNYRVTIIKFKEFKAIQESNETSLLIMHRISVIFLKVNNY